MKTKSNSKTRSGSVRYSQQFIEILQGKYVLSRDEITEAIEDEKWQAHRISMKGKATDLKLFMCDSWIRRHGFSNGSMIQVTNYINALKRGGQLDKQGKIRR